MILSNVDIVACLGAGAFSINPIAGTDPCKPPFNTSAVDLRLSNEIFVPDQNAGPTRLDLTKPGIAKYLQKHGQKHIITSQQPYSLEPNKLVLANTLEKVDFSLNSPGNICYSARVEGKSSLARCGILVHFTAPTIHAGFVGTITLEMINFGTQELLLFPEMFICQLIIEEVRGSPTNAPNQFLGQVNPVGTSASSPIP